MECVNDFRVQSPYTVAVFTDNIQFRLLTVEQIAFRSSISASHFEISPCRLSGLCKHSEVTCTWTSDLHDGVNEPW
jgi:hypothetical protein